MPRSSPASRAYLLSYNTLQCMGWTYVLLQTAVAAAQAWRSPSASGGLFVRPTSPLSTAASAAYTAAGPAVRACQGAALLETVHVVLGEEEDGGV